MASCTPSTVIPRCARYVAGQVVAGYRIPDLNRGFRRACSDQARAAHDDQQRTPPQLARPRGRNRVRPDWSPLSGSNAAGPASQAAAHVE
ncbi:hypothetical protein [Candidatus Amarolinea dominans]|uniref:hypothetical protein n=1 Tax=Candidatus Amarolinea dominans TaxID=3140696 RepID=UPI001E0CE1EA|nr:hypothetical protein [Anaerolineae bacterium]